MNTIARTATVALLATFAAGCERGPSVQEVADRAASCERAVRAWVQRQGSLGADYRAEPHYSAKARRCVAHIQGGETAATQFESVIDVQQDRVLAGCAAAREAIGDTPCQVEGQPAGRASGRMTIDRLMGR